MEISEIFKISAIFDHTVLTSSNAHMGFPGGSDGKAPACNAGDSGSVPGSGRAQREGDGNPSSILTWRIPWTEKSQSMGWQRVGHY